MEELIKDFSKMTNPREEDVAVIIDSEDREWKFVAKYWSKPGFYPGMVWVGQKGNPWMTSFGTSQGTIKSEFPRGVKSITINGLNESMDITNEVQRAVDNVMKNKDRYRNQDALEDAIYSSIWEFFQGWQFIDRDRNEVVNDIFMKELKRVGLNTLDEDRVPNQHEKPMGESNELEQRAKKHRKKSKGMGWHMAVNAGDVEKGIEVFNRAASADMGSSSGDGTAMGESVEYKTYMYEGPVYWMGHKIAESSSLVTKATSHNAAVRNILYQAANGDSDLRHYDIVDHLVVEVPEEKKHTVISKKRDKCQVCGYELNDIGDCPVCDYGEDDLLESLSDLEALWQLDNMF